MLRCAAALLALGAAFAVQAEPEAASAAALARFKGSGLEQKIAGRTATPTVVRGVTAYPDPEGGPAWYVDAETGVAGTREGLFELRRGQLMAMSKADTRKHQRGLASRVELPSRHIRRFGDGTGPTAANEFIYVTAFDCGPCREVEDVLARRSDQLDLRLHYLFDSLDDDDAVQQQLRNVQCASDSFAAFKRLAAGETVAATPQCAIPLHATGYAVTLLSVPYVPYFIERRSGRVVRWNDDAEALVDALNGSDEE